MMALSIDVPTMPSAAEPSRTRRVSPARIVNAALAVGVGISVALVFAATRLPALPLDLSVDGDVVREEGGGVVTAIRAVGSASSVAIGPLDVIEEPDVVATWAEFDAFMAHQGELAAVLARGTVEVEIDRTFHELEVVRRGPMEIPVAFWVLLLASLASWIVGFATYAFSDRGEAARMYVVSAVAFCVAVWPAAIYSTRSLAIEPEIFRWLSTIDHVGGLFFAAGVIAMVAVYPVRLVPTTSWVWLLAIAASVIGHLQVGEMELSGFYTANAVQFVLFVGFSAWQWRATRRDPVGRAAFGWVLLSTFVGVMFFFTLITLPILLGSRPLITQVSGFVSMVVMYAGISLGVLRYRLFDLDRWWFRTWSWILSGVAVVAIDLLLTRLFAVERGVAVVAAMLVVGWIYFPVRQWVLERSARARGAGPAYDTRELIAAATKGELHARLRAALSAIFTPLEILEVVDAPAAPVLSSDGAWLDVPSPARAGGFRCHFRENGARLFSLDDLARAVELVTLGASVRQAIDARVEGEDRERTRIRRDLHDDLGAAIIRIAHEANDERVAGLAKAAMRDLRDVLTSLEDVAAPCADVLDELEADLRERALADGRALEWTVNGTTGKTLAARSRANLTRVLRESMTNALKHGVGPVRYAFELDGERLEAVVENAVAPGAAPVDPGMGLENIAARLRELGGEARWERRGDRFRLDVTMPWSPPP